MSLKLGIVGLPNVGKSTLFNVLTKNNVLAENFPFCTVDPNVGKFIIEDERLDKLAEVDNPQRIVRETIEIVDIAGLVKGASNGEGLGNQFLANIREVDAIIHVIRCFKNDKILHVENRINPSEDKEIIDLELQLKDIETVNRRIEKATKLVKTGNKSGINELEFLERLKKCLENSKNVRSLIFEKNEKQMLKDMQLLTAKPVLYIANVNEKDLINIDKNENAINLKELISKESSEVIFVPIKIGEDVSILNDEEKETFIEECNLWNSCVNKFAKSAYKLLNLITFFTTGSDETRAWSIKNGTLAPQAAGTIHTDFEKKFIKAEICDFESYYITRKNNEKVLWRTEGKDYIIQDGDVVFFKI